MALPEYSALQTMTYMAGDDTYILDIPEAVPVFIKESEHKYIKFHTMKHDESKLGRTHEIIDNVVYIALESTDKLPIYAGYNCKKQPRPLTDAEQDAEIRELKAQIEEQRQRINALEMDASANGAYARSMELLVASEQVGANWNGWDLRRYEVDMRTKITNGYISATLTIGRFDLLELPTLYEWVEKFAHPLVKIETLYIKDMGYGEYGLPTLSALQVNGGDIAAIPQAIVYRLQKLLLDVNIFPDLTYLEIGRWEHTHKSFVNGWSYGSGSVYDTMCNVGYKYFDVLSRSKLKIINLGNLYGTVMMISEQQNLRRDPKYKMPADELRAIQRLMKEKNITVHISGWPTDC